MEWGWETANGMLVVREAVEGDASALLRLQRAVLAEGRFFISRPSELAGGLDAVIRQVRSFARAENSVFLVALLDGVPVGRLWLHGGVLARMAHTAKLEIMVSREVRGAGVGRALMEAAIAWATVSEVVEKIGLSVFSDNTAAIALYRAFGFEEEGRRLREYKMEDGAYRDDVLMFRWVLDGGIAPG